MRIRVLVVLLAAAVVAAVAVIVASPPAAVTVSAASSLTDAFTALGHEFTARTGTDVTFNFAGSQQLAAQIVQGAPVDVFASADETQMRVVESAGVIVGNVADFATNSLAIVTGPGNPLHITSLADLARPDLVVILAAPEVPVGMYSRRALEQAGVTVSPASLEPNVRAVVSKVALGEADAGIVYTTDVTAAGATVTGVPVAAAFDQLAHYPIALVGSARRADATAFRDFVLSSAGREILASYGFGAP